MSKIEDISRYLRDLDKVVAALESAETSSVGIYLANPITHELPDMDGLHENIRKIRTGVEESVRVAERMLKNIVHTKERTDG